MPFTDPDVRRTYAREWKARRRREWFRSQVCHDCGSRDALELHHLDPQTKTSHKIWSWSADRRHAELAKCVALCGNCHAAHTARQRIPLTDEAIAVIRGSPLPHTTLARRFGVHRETIAKLKSQRTITSSGFFHLCTNALDANAPLIFLLHELPHGRHTDCMPRGLGSIFHRKRRLADGTQQETATWFIQFCVNGKVHKESTGSEDYEEAKRILTRRLAEYQSGKPSRRHLDRIRVSELLDDLLTWYTTNRPETYAFAALHVKKLRLSFDDYLAAKLSTTDIEDWKAAQLAIPRKPASINRTLAILRRAYNIARKATPPKADIAPHFGMLKENNIRRGFFEEPEYHKVLAALPADVRPVVVFGYYTGCRKEEILSLRWDQVDLTRRTVYLGQTKNGEARMIPIGFTELLTTLQHQRDTCPPDCPWVFFYSDGSPIRSFKRSWKSACRTAGCPGRLFHDLRRTAARNLRRAGIDRDVIRRITGHLTDSVFSRYNIVNEADLHAAVQCYNQQA